MNRATPPGKSTSSTAALASEQNLLENKMKLLRYGPPGQEKPAALGADGKIYDLSGVITDVSGKFLLPERIEKLRSADLSALPTVTGQPRIGLAWAAWESSSALD
jgi:hypothetical protein